MTETHELVLIERRTHTYEHVVILVAEHLNPLLGADEATGSGGSLSLPYFLIDSHKVKTTP